jgi:BTB/POZ domain-containing protein KCTD9
MVFLALASLIVPLSFIFWLTDAQGFLTNVVAEAHGTLFDLFIIGWFLMWLSRRAERAMVIRRYREQIDDFLGWKSPTASHRIALNLRRLNRAGRTSDFRLTEAYVNDARLNEIKLTRSDLWGSTFRNASLEGADLTASNLGGANFTGAHLQHTILNSVDARGAVFEDAGMKDAVLIKADLRGANLAGADLQRANASEVNFEHANLERAILRESELSGASFRGASCRQAIFDGSVLRSVDFADADLTGALLDRALFQSHDEAISRLSMAKSLADATLDPHVKAAIRRIRPELFESQEDN